MEFHRSFEKSRNGCLYCYANFNDGLRRKNRKLHDPDSPLIFGTIDESKDKITKREMKTLIIKRENKLF